MPQTEIDLIMEEASDDSIKVNGNRIYKIEKLVEAFHKMNNTIRYQKEIGDVYGNAFRAGQHDILNQLITSLK